MMEPQQELECANREALDRASIRDVIEAWVIWRDSGQWDRLVGLWHDDGEMVATWKQARAADFVAGSRAAWTAGLDVQHLLGGTAIDLAGDRAIAQTKMTISQRATVHGVLVDVVCIGRFYDFFEKRAGRWGIVLRQPTYERDRMDPVEAGAVFRLDPALLSEFPAGYRHLAYVQTASGMQVKRNMPGRMGPEVDALYSRGWAWLAGRLGHPGDAQFGGT
jgi:hypothetical protein